MIAIATPTDAQIRLEFEKMLPELTSRFRCRFLEHGPDLQGEYAAEATAFAWAAYLSARRRGRTPSAGNLSWYAIRGVLSGRRLAGATSLDALSQTRVARNRIGTHVSIDDFEADRQSMFYKTWGDKRWRWPVVDIVSTRLDWDQFLSTDCDHRDRRIVEMKIEGCPQIEIADELGISPPAICQRLRSMKQRWDDARAVA